MSCTSFRSGQLGLVMGGQVRHNTRVRWFGVFFITRLFTALQRQSPWSLNHRHFLHAKDFLTWTSISEPSLSFIRATHSCSIFMYSWSMNRFGSLESARPGAHGVKSQKFNLKRPIQRQWQTRLTNLCTFPHKMSQQMKKKKEFKKTLN